MDTHVFHHAAQANHTQHLTEGEKMKVTDLVHEGTRFRAKLRQWSGRVSQDPAVPMTEEAKAHLAEHGVVTRAIDHFVVTTVLKVGGDVLWTVWLVPTLDAVEARVFWLQYDSDDTPLGFQHRVCNEECLRISRLICYKQEIEKQTIWNLSISSASSGPTPSALLL